MSDEKKPDRTEEEPSSKWQVPTPQSEAASEWPKFSVVGDITHLSPRSSLTITGSDTSWLTMPARDLIYSPGRSFADTIGTKAYITAGTIDLSSSEIRQLRADLQQAQSQSRSTQIQLGELSKQLQTLSTQQGTPDIDAIKSQLVDLNTTIINLQQSVGQAQAQTEKIVAPIEFPRPDDLRVQLVPTTWLDRLEEYRTDGFVASSFLFLALGIIGGIASNWVTNENYTITPASKLFMIAILLLALGAAVFTIQYTRRANRMKAKMMELNKSAAPSSEDANP